MSGDVHAPRWRLVLLPEALGLLVAEYATAAHALDLAARLSRIRGPRHRSLVVFGTAALHPDVADELRLAAPGFAVRVLDPSEWLPPGDAATFVVCEAIENAAEHDVIAILWPQSLHAGLAALVQVAAGRRTPAAADERRTDG